MVARALIFDLDGTVWDSAGWFAEGLSGDDPAAMAAFRRQLIAGGNIVGALRQAGVTRQRLLSQAYRHCGPPPLFDGVAEALGALAGRGTPLAAATSLPGTIAMPMLEMAGLTGRFAAVVHAGLCRQAKPNPASLLMALSMIGQSPAADVFYIGDRSSDASAAARAGVSFAWVRHGYEQPAAQSGIAAITPLELLRL